MKRRRHLFDDYPLPWFVATNHDGTEAMIHDHLGHCIFRNPTEDEPFAALVMTFEVAKVIADYANDYVIHDNGTVEFEGDDSEYIYEKVDETPVMRCKPKD